MSKIKTPKPQPLPPQNQPCLFGGETVKQTLGLPLFSGVPAVVAENAFTPQPVKGDAKQTPLF